MRRRPRFGCQFPKKFKEKRGKEEMDEALPVPHDTRPKDHQRRLSLKLYCLQRSKEEEEVGDYVLWPNNRDYPKDGEFLLSLLKDREKKGVFYNISNNTHRASERTELQS